jgi:hypothetical protein
MKRKVYFFIFIFSFTCGSLQAQQVLSSAGASATGVGVQLSWTIGEPVIETFTGTTAILTQGFHQSRLTVTAIDPTLFPELDLSVYPNPVSTSLQLQISGDRQLNLTYRLYNIEGKAILSKEIENFPEVIKMELFSSGTYLLKVFRDGTTPLKTFKVIKD